MLNYLLTQINTKERRKKVETDTLRILHISDTHALHSYLGYPDDYDMVVFSGDFTNHYDVFRNEPEARDFLNWYSALPIKYKILVAGNHDAYAFEHGKELREFCKMNNIIYLENESVVIEGVKIWGSPYTPQYGDWYFMKDRAKINKVWQQIPDDTDIIVTHGPPKGALDISFNRFNVMENCGCSALMKRIEDINPQLVLFGHIHNNRRIRNAGVLKLSHLDTTFSNGSCVSDGSMGILTSEGNRLEVWKKEK